MSLVSNRVRFFPTLALALTFLALPCLASRSRVTSLQGADKAFLIDNQTIPLNPAHGALLSSQFFFESGLPGSEPQGGFLMKAEDPNWQWGVLAGRSSHIPLLDTTSLRTLFGLNEARNPIEFFWAGEGQGYSVAFSHFKDPSKPNQERTLVLKYGQVSFLWEWWFHARVWNESQKELNLVTLNAPGLLLGGRYRVPESSWQWFGELNINQAQISGNSLQETGYEGQLLMGSFRIFSPHPKIDWYYGGRIEWTKRQLSSVTYDFYRQALPLFLGAEIRVGEFSFFRASYSQNFLFGQVDLAGTSSAAIGPNQKLNLGLGYRWEALYLDMVLEASQSGTIGMNPLFSQISLTYLF